MAIRELSRYLKLFIVQVSMRATTGVLLGFRVYRV